MNHFLALMNNRKVAILKNNPELSWVVPLTGRYYLIKRTATAKKDLLAKIEEASVFEGKDENIDDLTKEIRERKLDLMGEYPIDKEIKTDKGIYSFVDYYFFGVRKDIPKCPYQAALEMYGDGVIVPTLDIEDEWEDTWRYWRGLKVKPDKWDLSKIVSK